MTTRSRRTPYFVLMNAKRRAGPTLLPLPSGRVCEAIYGFSDKATYDAFCKASDAPLTPYPLVKGYLRAQADDVVGGALSLIAVDATGPCEPLVDAATIEAVLVAQERQTPCVTAGYRLRLDADTNAYRVESDSAGIE